jgi:hypothetical protein
VPPPAPITVDEVANLAMPFSLGIPKPLEPCRQFWTEVQAEPSELSLGPEENSLSVERGTIRTEDVDGDGVDDGVAAFDCWASTGIGRDGLLVIRASDRDPISNIALEMDDANTELRGDFKTVMRAPVSIERPVGGNTTIVVSVGSYVPVDPDAAPSELAVARFEIQGDLLRLVAYPPAP